MKENPMATLAVVATAALGFVVYRKRKLERDLAILGLSILQQEELIRDLHQAMAKEPTAAPIPLDAPTWQNIMNEGERRKLTAAILLNHHLRKPHVHLPEDGIIMDVQAQDELLQEGIHDVVHDILVASGIETPKEHVPTIEEGLKGTWGAVKHKTMDATKAVQDTTNEEGRKISQDLSKATNKGKEMVRSLSDSLASGVQQGVDATYDAAQRTVDATYDAAQRTKDAVSNTAQRAKDTVSSGAQQTKDVISNTAQRAKDTVSSGTQQTKDAVSNTAQRTKDTVSGGAQRTKDKTAMAVQQSKEEAALAAWQGTDEAFYPTLRDEHVPSSTAKLGKEVMKDQKQKFDRQQKEGKALFVHPDEPRPKNTFADTYHDGDNLFHNDNGDEGSDEMKGSDDRSLVDKLFSPR